MAWVFIHSLMITIDGLSDEAYTSDVAVVLGNTVNSDGTLSPRLEARIVTGLNLYHKQIVKKILVSGGLGKEGHYEGSKMKSFLLEKGVPEKDILVDNNGGNTYASALNTKNIVDEYGFNTVIVVSQFYHIHRAKQTFREFDFVRVSGVHCPFFEARDMYGLLREFFACYYYLFI